MPDWQKVACVCVILSYNIIVICNTNVGMGLMSGGVIWGSTGAFVAMTFAFIAAFMIFNRRMDMPTIGTIILIIVLFINAGAIFTSGAYAYDSGNRHVFSMFFFAGILAVSGAIFFIVDACS